MDGMTELTAKCHADGSPTDEFKAEVIAAVANSHARTSGKVAKWLESARFTPGTSINIAVDTHIEFVER